MLKNNPPALTADLLWSLAAMGHGDVVAVVDQNYPAHALHSRVITLAGIKMVEAVEAIAGVFPIDQAADPAVTGMVPDVGPAGEIPSHTWVSRILTAEEGRPVQVAPVRRTKFYSEASKAFAVVLTGETSSYACFLLTKGVVVEDRSREAGS